MNRTQALRIVDANLNRSREGLRVAEEIARFVLNDASLTRQLKAARHRIAVAIRNFPVPLKEIVGARNVRGDVGKAPSPLEEVRSDARDVFIANVERVKEALRVLEETAKIFDLAASRRFKLTRFKVYAIEKRALPKLEALRHNGSNRRRAKGPRRRDSRGDRRRR